MGNSKAEKVYLDHLISRQSIRYVQRDSSHQIREQYPRQRRRSPDPYLRYSDIGGDWFSRIRKPDFQRETSAWSAIQCVEFLESVIRGRIIPSLILWQSEENGSIYVLDGAHRLSVIRAWMVDDWGDSSDDYYERRDLGEIHFAAKETKSLVKHRIGRYSEYEQAYHEREQIIKNGGTPRTAMPPRHFDMASIYGDMVIGNQTLFVQWEEGDYESAEQSFLRINRQGQPLQPWEATLIEFRNSSYARTIMSIANGGETGHYWPEPHEDEKAEYWALAEDFPSKAKSISTRLFVPPFRGPIKDLTVPMVVAPAYFQKHQYLLELIPLIGEATIALTEEQQVKFLKRDYKADPQTLIINASRLLSRLDKGIEHINSLSNSSTSLSIVPLIYWYNDRGVYKRSLLYGFLYWLLSGAEGMVKERKIVFSVNRDRFETVIFNFKSEIADYARSIGAGLKSVKRMAEFYQDLLYFLNDNQDVKSDSLEEVVLGLLSRSSRKGKAKPKSSRKIGKGDKTQVNIRELFHNSIKCHICGGIVNLKDGGLQYDHVQDYAKVQQTDPDELKPTHPFCNNLKPKILDVRNGVEKVILPKLVDDQSSISSGVQLTFWSDDFPG